MSDKVQKSVRVGSDLANYIEQEAETRAVKEADVMRELLRDGVQHRNKTEEIVARLRRIERRIGDLENHTEEIAQQQNAGGLLR